LNLGSTGAKSKPALDESSFQQLLAAAFVVQQHNEGLRAKDPARATSSVLSEIAEIQSLVRAGELEFSAAARLASERLQKITRADDVRVSLSRDGVFDCIAEIGSVPHSANSLATRSIVALEHLRAGYLIQASDVASDARLKNGDSEAGSGSLIAAPIHCFDEFSGVIELLWLRANAFQESDGRTARLMAGLISGLLERKLRARGRNDIATTPIAATAQVEPGVVEADSAAKDLIRIPQVYTAAPPELGLGAAIEAGPEKDLVQEYSSAEPTVLPEECRVCGRPFGADEAFCGQCSMPRVAGAPSDDLQSKWASLWYMQRAQAQRDRVETLPSPPPAISGPTPLVHHDETAPVAPPRVRETDPSVRIWHVPESKFRRDLPKPTFELFTPETQDFDLDDRGVLDDRAAKDTKVRGFVVPTQPEPDLRSDPDLLQSTWQTVWARMRRRHATLALTAVGFLLLFLMLAVWPSSKNSQLTWFQSVLVQLGLAEVPSHPRVFAGNPEARVWVDLHTALYYCQGSDLYGKTPGGHFATQHEAQQDEFEPATRVPCP
jgi:hypothetical protein